MAIVYDLPPGTAPNPYMTAQEFQKELERKRTLLPGGHNPAPGQGIAPSLQVGYDVNPDGSPVSGLNSANQMQALTQAQNPVPEQAPAQGQSVADQVAAILGQQGGSAADQLRASALAAAEAQRIATQQQVDQLEYRKTLAQKARADANREADMTFSRAINPTGKLNQNIRSAGLAGSGWQETSRVGLTNEYQNAMNANTGNYNQAVNELNLTIAQARQSGDAATLQLLSNYASQLAQQLYQEARAAVADQQWEKSYQLQLAAFELEKSVKQAAMSGGSGSSGGYSSGGGGGGSSGSGKKSAGGIGQLFDENGNLVSAMTPDELQLYYLNHPIYDPDTGEEIDYERFYPTLDSFRVDSSWGSDPASGVMFEIDNSIGRNTTPQEAAQIAASYVYSNSEYLTDAEMDDILRRYGLDQDTAAAILTGTGTASASVNRHDPSISDNDMAYWKLFGGGK